MNRSIASIGLLLLAITGFCTAGNADEMTAQTLLQGYVENVGERAEVTRALDAFKQANFEQARTELVAASQTDPALPPAGLLLARMFFAANQPALGRAELESVRISDPQDPGPLLIFGELAIEEQRMTDAELAFRQALKLIEQFSGNDFRKNKMMNRTRLGLAAFEESRERWQAAIEMLRPVFESEPQDTTTASRLAKSLFRVGDTQAARDMLQKNWQTEPEKIQRPELTMGLLYQSNDQLDLADESMNKAAELDATRGDTQIAIANWALERGDLKLAQACADRAIAATNSSLETRLLAAVVSRYRGDYNTARQLLESVHLESPANLGALIELSMVLSQIEGLENPAIQYAQLATKLQPDLRKPAGRNAAMSLAWLLYKFGGQAESEKIVAQVLSNGQVSNESGYFAAKILLEKNRPAARKLLRDLIDNNRRFPGFDDAQQLLSEID